MAEKARFYLDCPFSEKDEAKGLGAFWDADVRKWYVPENIDKDPFAKWFPGTNADYQEPVHIEETKRFYLDVEFSDKDEVKKLGARWDPKVRKWWAASEDREKFISWWPDEGLRVVDDENPPF